MSAAGIATELLCDVSGSGQSDGSHLAAGAWAFRRLAIDIGAKLDGRLEQYIDGTDGSDYRAIVSLLDVALAEVQGCHPKRKEGFLRSLAVLLAANIEGGGVDVAAADWDPIAATAQAFGDSEKESNPVDRISLAGEALHEINAAARVLRRNLDDNDTFGAKLLARGLLSRVSVLSDSVRECIGLGDDWDDEALQTIIVGGAVPVVPIV